MLLGRKKLFKLLLVLWNVGVCRAARSQLPASVFFLFMGPHGGNRINQSKRWYIIRRFTCFRNFGWKLVQREFLWRGNKGSWKRQDKLFYSYSIICAVCTVSPHVKRSTSGIKIRQAVSCCRQWLLNLRETPWNHGGSTSASSRGPWANQWSMETTVTHCYLSQLLKR